MRTRCAVGTAVLVLALLLAVAAPAQSSPPGWVKLTPAASPSPRASSAMAYDVRAHRTILFGGITEVLSPGPAETWEFDAETDTWTNLNLTSSPAGQYAASMVYDAHADRIILFGGSGYGAGVEWLNDTWAYSYGLNAWYPRFPPRSPPARNTFGMAYDSRADRIVIFGGTGVGGSELLSDTWVYDDGNDTWTNVTGPTGPSARSGPAMVYDAASDRILMYGGVGMFGDLYDTWAFSLGNATWWPLNPGGTPFAVRSSVMSFDASTGRAVLFGGYCLGGPQGGRTGTWEYEDGTNRWTSVLVPLSPPCLNQASMVYDSGLRESILFGGGCSVASCGAGLSNATWTFLSAASTGPGPSPTASLLPLVLGMGLTAAAGGLFTIAVWRTFRHRRFPPGT